MMNVILYPDKTLKMKSEPISEITDEVRTTLKEMFETMTANSKKELYYKMRVNKR